MDILPKLISVLLQYPDEALLESRSEIQEIVSEMPDERSRLECAGLLEYLGRTPLIRVQEEYTRTFDLNPETSLNLSHHKWGDARERGGAMAALSGLYREEGYEIQGGELPDHLPLILEFFSICSDQAGKLIREDYRKEVALLAERLKKEGSPYAALLELAAGLFIKIEPQNTE